MGQQLGKTFKNAIALMCICRLVTSRKPGDWWLSGIGMQTHLLHCAMSSCSNYAAWQVLDAYHVCCLPWLA